MLFDLTGEDDEGKEIEETVDTIGNRNMESMQSSFKQLLMGGVSRFWQSPRKQEREPWWKSMISSPARRLVDANQAHQHQPMSGIPTVVLPDPSQEVEAPQARGENHRKQVVRVRVETKVDISVFEDSSSAGEVKDCSQECSRGHRRGLLLELQQGVEGVKAKCGTDHLETAFNTAFPLTVIKIRQAP